MTGPLQSGERCPRNVLFLAGREGWIKSSLRGFVFVVVVGFFFFFLLKKPL